MCVDTCTHTSSCVEALMHVGVHMHERLRKWGLKSVWKVPACLVQIWFISFELRARVMGGRPKLVS